MASKPTVTYRGASVEAKVTLTVRGTGRVFLAGCTIDLAKTSLLSPPEPVNVTVPEQRFCGCD